MAMKLKIKGKSGGSKPSTKRSTSKSTSRSNGSKSASTKKTTGKKKTTGRKPASKPAARRERTYELNQRQTKLADELKEVGDERIELHEAHKDAVDRLGKKVKQALAAGVPMKVVFENSQISRQWIYKINNHSGRDAGTSNGSTSKKSTSKKTSTAKKSSGRKTVAKKSGGKKLKVRS